MSAVWPILGMGTGVYTLRIVGQLQPRGLTLPPAWEQALGFVPVAVLTALVVSSLAGPAHIEPAKIVAAVIAAMVAGRSGRLWACIVSGMAAYWLLRLL